MLQRRAALTSRPFIFSEVQAPVNGSQAYKNGTPSPNFKVEIK